MLRLRFVAPVIALLLAGCGQDVTTDEQLSDADALSQEVITSWISARADGMTVWLSPSINAAVVDGQTRWTISGRTSRNLQDAFSYVPDDAFGTARVISPRKFDLTLTNDELRTLVVGRQLLVRLTPTTGTTPYTIAISGAPSFVSQEGAPRIYLHSAVVPVVMGQQLVFRGRASTTSNMDRFEVHAANAEPLVTHVSTRTWTFDWSHTQLAIVAAGFSGTVTLEATNSAAETFTRTGALAIRTTKVAITNGDPELAFPVPSCDTGVKACLSSLTDPNLDTSGCGSAVQVLACGGVRMQAISADRFAAELRAQLADYYALHGADIAQAGGNTLAQAQAAVSSAQITEVLENGEDPRAYDLSRIRVFRHPDVVFPGSDRAWFGAYDRATGALLEIYDFN